MYVLSNDNECHRPFLYGVAVAEWLNSWLAEQEDRGSIPGLATWIFRDWLSPASKSRYGWKIAKSTWILKTTNQPTNLSSTQSNLYFAYHHLIREIQNGRISWKRANFSRSLSDETKAQKLHNLQISPLYLELFMTEISKCSYHVLLNNAYHNSHNIMLSILNNYYC